MVPIQEKEKSKLWAPWFRCLSRTWPASVAIWAVSQQTDSVPFRLSHTSMNCFSTGQPLKVFNIKRVHCLSSIHIISCLNLIKLPKDKCHQNLFRKVKYYFPRVTAMSKWWRQNRKPGRPVPCPVLLPSPSPSCHVTVGWKSHTTMPRDRQYQSIPATIWLFTNTGSQEVNSQACHETPLSPLPLSKGRNRSWEQWIHLTTTTTTANAAMVLAAYSKHTHPILHVTLGRKLHCCLLFSFSTLAQVIPR